MATNIFDVEQQMLLLELDPPFDKRAVQLARRRMAKRWHPDIAPQGKQFEHERHLKAINGPPTISSGWRRPPGAEGCRPTP
jgi:hypothetical protein